MEYWTPESFVSGIEKSEGTPQETLKNIINAIEKQARELLTESGYGIEAQYLTPNDIEQDRKTWLNEALHLLDYDLLFEEDKAVLTLIETSKAEDFLTADKAYEAALSMANITALTLLPNDLISQGVLEKTKSKHKERFRNAGQKGGKAKRGHKGETRLLVECYYDDFITDKDETKNPAQLANKILARLKDGCDLNRDNTGASNVELLEDENAITYTLAKTLQTKLINQRNLEKTIRKIRNDRNFPK